MSAEDMPSPEQKAQLSAAVADALGILTALGLPDLLRYRAMRGGVDASFHIAESALGTRCPIGAIALVSDRADHIVLRADGWLYAHDIINHPHDWIEFPPARRVPLEEAQDFLVQWAINYLHHLTEGE